jgi:hypothetical protein
MSTLLNIDPVQAILGQTALRNTLFSPASRYYGLDTATLARPGRAPVVYLLRRFVPPPSRFQTIQEHAVLQGERLDNITAQHLADATLFWRLCDANRTMRPDELTEPPGRRIRITLPEGVTGTPL